MSFETYRDRKDFREIFYAQGRVYCNTIRVCCLPDCSKETSPLSLLHYIILPTNSTAMAIIPSYDLSVQGVAAIAFQAIAELSLQDSRSYRIAIKTFLICLFLPPHSRTDDFDLHHQDTTSTRVVREAWSFIEMTVHYFNLVVGVISTIVQNVLTRFPIQSLSFSRFQKVFELLSSSEKDTNGKDAWHDVIDLITEESGFMLNDVVCAVEATQCIVNRVAYDSVNNG
jgi:hypothetical protein